MAESVFARPSFWKVPREFRERSRSPNPYANSIEGAPFQTSLQHRDFLSEDYYYEKIAQKSHQQQPQQQQQQQQHQLPQQHTPLCRIHNFNQVTPLSSASDAGVKAGDVLIAVNNKSIAGEPLDRVTKMIGDDKCNNVTLTIARPNCSPSMGTVRPVSPLASGFAAAGSSPLPPPQPAAILMKQLPRSPVANRRYYDPASIQDQERQVYEEEKYNEQLAIKTTPYRSQAVVSPRPKTKHDHVIGSYLKMQHYPDAPIHGSPVPDSYLPVNAPPGHFSAVSPQAQAKFNSALKQAVPTAEELGFKLTYNSPIGLYSQENAVNTLKQTNPLSAKQPVQGNTYDPMKLSASPVSAPLQPGHIPKPVKLVPDDTLVDGADFARNLANSPTYRLVQELEGPGRHHDPVNDRVYTPVPIYEDRQFGETERHSPAQSSSFKSLMNSLIAHPKV